MVCFFVSVLLAACGSGSEGSDGSISIVNVTAKALEAPVYGENDPAASSAATGANGFAFRLSAALIKEEGSIGENFVCSPYSVWLPLAALLNATDAQYTPALLAAIGAAGISQDDVNRAASRMLYDMTNFGGQDDENYFNPLKIANAIFVGNNVTLRKDFAQAFMDFYRGYSINVDFSSRDAVDAVNRWASDNTEGLITNIIQEFDLSTVAAIANAIYFSDRWSWEFNPEETKEGVFHAQAGDTTAQYMLREGSSQTYYEDGRVKAMPLWFKKSGGLYIMLPKTGSAEELLSSMTKESFDEIWQNSYLAEGKLLLPRFSTERGSLDLVESLKILGVPLFEDGSLSGLLMEEYIQVQLTSAVQKALIRVDEKGTTAAAVTVMVGDGSAGPQPNKPFEMVCDRPFVFILFGQTYDGGRQILFTGIVNRPE